MFLSRIRQCCRLLSDKCALDQSMREAFMTKSQIPWPLRLAVIVVFMLGVFLALTAAPAASFGLTGVSAIRPGSVVRSRSVDAGFTPAFKFRLFELERAHKARAYLSQIY